MGRFSLATVFMDKETERAGCDESLERYGHPYGMHLCVPPEEILVIKTTGGTTGLPTFTYSFTANDMARWNEVFMVNGEAYVGSCNQEEYKGLHEVAPDLTIWAADLVDPETHKLIPVEEGAIGEGVFTSLKREGTPLIKYASGDIVQIESGRCTCIYPGSGYRVRILGRLSNRLLINGKSIYPVAIRDVVVSYIPMVTGVMRIVLKSLPPKIEPPLLLKVEHGINISNDALDDLSNKITKDIFNRFGVPS